MLIPIHGSTGLSNQRRENQVPNVSPSIIISFFILIKCKKFSYKLYALGWREISFVFLYIQAILVVRLRQLGRMEARG